MAMTYRFSRPPCRRSRTAGSAATASRSRTGCGANFAGRTARRSRGATAPSPYPAACRWKRPFAPAVHTFFAHSDAPYYIMPAHLLERYSDLNRVAFNSKPIGTGPFRVVRWVRGDRIEYGASDAYF